MFRVNFITFLADRHFAGRDAEGAGVRELARNMVGNSARASLTSTAEHTFDQLDDDSRSCA
jgi:hypothetical protein